MEQMTVLKLAQLCEHEIKRGNGNKKVVVASDPEGNEFNGLWGGFASVDKYIFGLIGDSENDETLTEARKNLIALGVI